MFKNSSAKYYQDNKGYKKTCERYQSFSTEERNVTL